MMHDQAEQAMTTDEILEERGKRYGTFKDHATISQALKCVIMRHMGERYNDMEADQCEALEMICHKVARVANGDPDYEDSWRDISGYAQLVADRLRGIVR